MRTFRLSMLIYVSFLASGAWSSVSHRPLDQIEQANHAKDPGAVIYQKFCQSCHAAKPIIPLGAPRLRHLSDWQARTRQGYSSLLKNLRQGIGNMPPRGGCFECSDTLLEQATRYMLPPKLLQKWPRTHR